MRKNVLFIIGLGVVIIVFALILVLININRGDDMSTIQKNTTGIFSEQKTQKIESTLKNNKQKFSTQKF